MTSPIKNRALLLVLALLFLCAVFSQAHAASAPLRFVGNDDYCPVSYLENGVPQGMGVEIINAVSRAMGREMSVQLLDWGRAQDMVQHGEADVVGLLAVTDQRKALYDFTGTVMQLEYSLVVRSEESAIKGVADLKGKTIGAATGSFPLLALSADKGIRLVTVATYQEGLRKVLKGEIQAFAADKWVALYILQQRDIKYLKVLDRPFAVRDAAFAVRKGNLGLRDGLNHALEQLKKDGVIKEIQRKWSGKQVVVLTKEKLTSTIVGAVSALALVLLSLLSFWVYTLKRQVGERRLAQRLLQESEERYRTLFEMAPDAILVCDSNERMIVDANANATRLFGCLREELIGSTMHRFYPANQPDGLPIEESMLLHTERALSGDEASFERVLRNCHGETLICEVRLSRLPSRERTLIRASFIDVTGRRRAEQSQRAADQRFRDIFENAPVGIYRTSAERRFIDLNPALAHMYGYDTPEEAIAKVSDVSVELFVDPGLREALVREVLASDSFVQREVEYRRRDGSNFSGNLFMRAVRGDDGAFLCFEGFVEDITSRKKALAELSKLSQAVEQSPVSIVITDSKGDIEFVNANFIQLTGFQRHEVLGQNPRLIRSGATPSELYQNLWSTITSGKVWEGELENKKKNGELFWERVTVSPIRDGEGRITNYMAIKEDITEQRNMKELLFQSQKMEAIGQLAGGIAHDFNNILTVIMGYGNLLRLSPQLPPELSEKANMIIASADKAAQLTRGLLAFSRKQLMDPRQWDLNYIVQHLRNFLVRVIGEDVQLKLVINAPRLQVKVDSGQIEQVLMNLATNARDAMPRGGLLVIETSLREIEPSPDNSLPGLREAGRYAVISVSDTGIGMDAETRSKIFEPFFTTKEVGKGTGLGMSMVHGIISQHNGFINVYSELGQGTTFNIYLPLCEEESPSGQERVVAQPVRGGRETVLVAEDDAAVRGLMQQILTGFGYTVLLANDGEEAVSVFRDNHDGIGLVVMDMIMPKRSGWDASREIAMLRPGTRILFTSGYTKDFIKNRGELKEGTELILKPVQPLEFLRKVREILDR